MSTELLSVQPSEAFGYRESDLDAKMTSDISNPYGAQSGWNPEFYDSYIMPSNHARFTMPAASMSRKTIPTSFDSHMLYSRPTFIATGAAPQNQDVATISPSQTRYAANNSSPQSHTNSMFDISHSPNNEEGQLMGPPGSLRTDSARSSQDSGRSSTSQRSTGRKRKSEIVEDGTPRAIYLEKNRKAASKCRSKQKQQQEDLVEEARTHERRNKLLKAEVDMLQHGLRDLMEIVGQHTNCPDSRLSTYVQREADRLAAGRSSSCQFTGLSKSPPNHSRHISPTTLSSSIDLQ
jgi:cyclic AMP-dependent transcription factor ATF-2